jgi:tRNA(Ile)-lysidine synthase
LSLSTNLLDELSTENRIFVAFSGGLDSTALLFLCNKALKQKKISNLKAIHINHNLSKNSDDWQQHCESFCRSNNIEFESFVVEVPNLRSSIESQARQARYKIFESLLDENDQILLAHHRDDVFETILLRLFRGTGVDGLSGMNDKRSLGKGEIVRPFLNLPKSDLRIFIDENDLPYVEDDTNSKNDFDRNFLRNEIVPSLEKRWNKLSERVTLTSLTAKKKKLSLDFMLEKNFKKEISTGIIERANFIEMPSFLIEELIRLILRKKGVALPSQKVLSEIMNVFFHKKPTNESYVEWSRKDGEQIGGKVFSEHNDIIFKKK